MLDITFKNYSELVAYIHNVHNYKRVLPKQQKLLLGAVPCGSIITYRQFKKDITTENEVFLFGSLGTFRKVNLLTCTPMTFSDGTPVNLGTINMRKAKGVLDWTEVTNHPEKKAMWALYMPAKYPFKCTTPDGVGVLQLGITRYGGVIVCPDKAGVPDIDKAVVLDAIFFAEAFENKGWVSKLAEQIAQCYRPMKDSMYDIICLDMQSDTYVMNYFEMLRAEVNKRFTTITEIFEANYASDMTLSLFTSRIKAVKLCKFPAYHLIMPKDMHGAYLAGVVMRWLCIAWVQENIAYLYKVTKRVQVIQSIAKRNEMNKLCSELHGGKYVTIEDFYFARMDYCYLWLNNVQVQEHKSEWKQSLCYTTIDDKGNSHTSTLPIDLPMIEPVMRELDKVDLVQMYLQSRNSEILRKVHKIVIPKETECYKRLSAVLFNFFELREDVAYCKAMNELLLLCKHCVQHLQYSEFKICDIKKQQEKHQSDTVLILSVTFKVIGYNGEIVPVKLSREYTDTDYATDVTITVAADSKVFLYADVYKTLVHAEQACVLEKPYINVAYSLAVYLCNLFDKHSVLQGLCKYSAYSRTSEFFNPQYGLQLESGLGWFKFQTEWFYGVGAHKLFPIYVSYNRKDSSVNKEDWWQRTGDIINIRICGTLKQQLLKVDIAYAVEGIFDSIKLNACLRKAVGLVRGYAIGSEFEYSCVEDGIANTATVVGYSIKTKASECISQWFIEREFGALSDLEGD